MLEHLMVTNWKDFFPLVLSRLCDLKSVITKPITSALNCPYSLELTPFYATVGCFHLQVS